jgi:CheY-like chemotaxis protein
MLPRLQSVDAVAAFADAVARPNLAGKRILVVDDDEDSREITSKALAGTGATVTQASSGGEALNQWRAQRFDVLICDLAMPGMDGFEVLRTIRSTPELDGHQSRAIALTALASDADRQAVIDAGFDDHIVKPFSFSDLLRAVASTA